ncbi:MAG: dipeptidase [Cyclobacteriaceae bacterium]|nr:MAG: dipeptidase [Cyclobacteriaceae bacterium]
MKYLLAICLLIAFSTCNDRSNGKANQQTMDSLSLKDRASALAQKTIILDGHVDLPYRLQSLMEDVGVRTNGGDFDFVRAREGGLDAPFMSIYVPSSYQEDGGAAAYADQLIDLVKNIAANNPDKFGIAKNPEEVELLFHEGKIALPMGMENGAPLEKDITKVQYFYDRGIRYITLTHAKDNLICDSSYDTTRTWNGLSDFGRQVVQEMNKVGIMVDVSHISDEAFFQVMEISQAPAIASHSSCRQFTPGWERNMSDEMIIELAKNDGVIQINFGSTFLDQASRNSSDQIKIHQQQWEEQHPDLTAAEVENYRSQYHSQNYVYADVSKVADHIDHVVSIAGVEHVGLGSDFDGVGNTLPEGLKDVSQYPNLIEELLSRGYSEQDIAKICYQNVFRVWNKTAEVAAKLKEN